MLPNRSSSLFDGEVIRGIGRTAYQSHRVDVELAWG